MRTTIDLPDALLRQVKARAALDGLKLKDLITRYVAEGLEQGTRVDVGAGDALSARPRRCDLPVMIPARGRRLTALTNGEVQALLDAEDATHAAAAPRRLD
jgi:hypothetical protein